MTGRSVLVICGLDREARLAAGPGRVTITSGGSRTRLEAKLASLDPSLVSAVLSFGLAGGIDPTLAVGDVILTRDVLGAAPVAVAEAAPWSDGLRESLVAGGFSPIEERILGVDAAITTPAAKAALHRETGAVAVDMESHIGAAYAARHGLAFCVLRVVSDGADRAIPPAALTAMRPDGGINVAAVIRSLARDPRQIPAMIATARDGARAFRVLGRVGRLLGGGVGLHL